MADNAKILEDLKTAIETWNVQLAVDSTNAAIEAGIEPKVIVNDGLGMGMADVGRRFDAAEIFLPQVVAASKTMEAALKILEPLMSGGASAMKGTVVMGTVEETSTRSERTCAVQCSAEQDTQSSTSVAMSPHRTSSMRQRRMRPSSWVDRH